MFFRKRIINEDNIKMMAKEFAKNYSEEIEVVAVEYIGSVEHGYPCVELHFPKNNDLRNKLLATGHCTRLDSFTFNGVRMQGVLLWFDKKGKNIIKKIPKYMGYPTS